MNVQTELKALNLEFPMNKMNAINDIKLFKSCIYNTNDKKKASTLTKQI